MRGSLAIALLFHVPYVRRAGVWPHGEGNLYEAMAGIFIPILDQLLSWRTEGVAARPSIALSPVLADQLADPLVRAGFDTWLRRWVEDGGGEQAQAIQESWYTTHFRDLVRTLRELQLDGVVEILGVPATATVLPLLGRVSARRGQVAQGLRTLKRHLEFAPRGLWLPGGAGPDPNELETSLEGIEYLVGAATTPAGTPATGGAMDPVGTGGPCVLLPRHEGLANALAPLAEGDDVAARVGVAMDQGLDWLAAHERATGRAGVMVWPMDPGALALKPAAPRLLAEVVAAARQRGLRMVSAGEACHLHPAQAGPEAASPSWEEDGSLRPWQGSGTIWYWDIAEGVQDHVESLADRWGGAIDPVHVRMLAQAVREGQILLSPEWPRMLGQGGGDREYAAERVRNHHDRFRLLAEALEAGDTDVALLERFEGLDNPFPDLLADLFAKPVRRYGEGDEDRP